MYPRAQQLTPRELIAKATAVKELLDELSDQFEEIEHKMFGDDGFEDAADKIGDIETTLGVTGLSQFTAPASPMVKG